MSKQNDNGGLFKRASGVSRLNYGCDGFPEETLLFGVAAHRLFSHTHLVDM
jgi:hypothetical protein